ncbi:MAG: hypothetical protein ACRCXT_08650 [Paraclostridium sp.]
MKKSKIVLLVTIYNLVAMALIFVIIDMFQVSTIEKIEDLVVQKKQLMKEVEGGLISHSDRLMKIEMDLKDLRSQLAEESQAKRK